MTVQDSRSMRRVLGVAVLLAASVGVWSGCPGGDGGNDGGQDAGQDAGADSGSGGDAGSDAGLPEPSISASSQTLALSTDLTIASVTATASSFVVVTAPLGDGGTASGAAAVSAGTASNLHVGVGDPLADGTLVDAELHLDLGTAGTYEPGTDPLVMTDAGAPVSARFQVTVPAGTPAVRYTATPTCSPIPCVWRLGVTPANFAGTLNSTGTNPTLTLYAGWRYEVLDSLWQFHPFELIDTSGGTDVVLLSMKAGVGTLKDDPTIGWVDGNSTNGAGRFTLSPTLQAALTNYRCGVHTTTMRAPISIQTR